MRKTRSLTCGVAIALFCGACGEQGAPTAVETPRAVPVVYTTFYPTTYFAERIAGDAATVVCPVPEGEDPIFWQPDDDTIRAYQEADLIVVNGAQFEKWVLHTSLPETKVVDTASGFEDEFLTFEEAVEHSHGPAGAHAHEGIDGHTWLDPLLAKRQATRIAGAVKRLLPERAVEIDDRLTALHADLDALHREFGRLTEGYAGERILASHPAYNYLVRRYGWKVTNLDLDPEAMPDEETFAAIRTLQEEQPARYLLWESAPTAEVAARFRSELGLESVELSPGELRGEAERAAGLDYLAVMKRNIERLVPVLTPPR